MESWVIGFDGDPDVERHAGSKPGRSTPPIHLRVVSDYI
jgi:hypothetical protein